MRPTQRCLLIFLAGLPAAALPVLVSGGLWPVWILWIGLAALATGIDALLGLPEPKLEIDVDAPPQLYVGGEHAARVRLQSRGWGASRDLRVLCELSDILEPRAEFRASLPAGETAEITLPLLPRARGMAVIERVWARWTGPLGLMGRRTVRPQGLEVPVVTNIKAVRAAALRFSSKRDLTGGRSIRFIGQGSEFDAMREYVPGLDHRAISWKATARHRTLVCREFRAERNRQIIIAIDTGHLMAEPLDGMPKLDHAIHAGLVLAYTGLRMGDRIGLYAFDETVRTYATPRGGVKDFQRIQHVAAGLDYTSAETNFTLGLAELSRRLNRRSLVVVLTDFVDTITAELMIENVGRISRRHLLIFVSFRDVLLTQTADAPPGSLDRLYRSVVAADFIRERELVLRRLQRLGIMTVDAAPGSVTTNLLNRYLSIKQRELI